MRISFHSSALSLFHLHGFGFDQPATTIGFIYTAGMHACWCHFHLPAVDLCAFYAGANEYATVAIGLQFKAVVLAQNFCKAYLLRDNHIVYLPRFRKPARHFLHTIFLYHGWSSLEVFSIKDGLEFLTEGHRCNAHQGNE